MGLVINNEYGLDIKDSINIQELNYAIRKLVENDLKMGQNGNSPHIWECTWYNKDKTTLSNEGYGIGDMVWINTEDVNQFIQFNENDIRRYAEGNQYASQKVKRLSSDMDRPKLLQIYRDMVNGENGYDRLYYLGNLTDDVQIRVSLSDNNIYPPDNDDYWKDFIRRDLNDQYYYDQMLDILTFQLSSQFEDHEVEYHLKDIVGNGKKYGKNEFIDKFLKSDMSNISKKQTFLNCQFTENMEGFDYVVQNIVNEYGNGCVKWFRLWSSGLLEHGGTVDKRYYSVTEDNLIYNNTFYQVNFGWSGNFGTAPTYNYPNIVFGSFYRRDQLIDTDEDAGQIEYENRIDALDWTYRYQISVCPLDAGTLATYKYHNSQNSKNTYYVTKDITNMNNSSFAFHIGQYNRFSYYVRGFVQR